MLKREYTLVILKPDAVERGLMGRIISRFEDAGIAIVGMKMVQSSRELASTHYGDLDVRYSAEVKEQVVSWLISGPVVVMALAGPDVLAFVRKLVGKTNPLDAQPGTIRGDFSSISMDSAKSIGLAVPNLVHASAKPDEAEVELSLWFETTGEGAEPLLFYDYIPRFARGV